MEQGQTQMGEIFGVKVGNGAVLWTSGETQRVVHVGEEEIPFSFATFDTDAFDVIVGNNFFEANPHIKYLSLQAPQDLLVRRHGQLMEVPLNEESTPRPSVQIIKVLSLNLGAYMKLEGMVALHAQLARTENYKLSTEMKRQGFADLSLERDLTGLDFIELFASKQNADPQYLLQTQGQVRLLVPLQMATKVEAAVRKSKILPTLKSSGQGGDRPSALSFSSTRREEMGK